jgi:hypothetical protein
LWKNEQCLKYGQEEVVLYMFVAADLQISRRGAITRAVRNPFLTGAGRKGCLPARLPRGIILLFLGA